MSQDLKEILSDIQIKMAEELLKRIESGSATAADLQVARQLLRDNNIQAGRPQANPSLMRIAQTLPFPTEAEAG